MGINARTIAMSVRHRTQAALFVALLSLATGCGQAVFRKAVPEELVTQAQVAGMPNVRFWGDEVDPQLQRDFARAIQEHPITQDPNSEAGPGYGGLVLSGGGDGGAYGAGLLCGWTENGDRPRFRIVTGVSTGALIAPFAFLGPKYDDSLRFYTRISQKDVLTPRWIIDWFSYDSAYDNDPLQKQLQKMI